MRVPASARILTSAVRLAAAAAGLALAACATSVSEPGAAELGDAGVSAFVMTSSPEQAELGRSGLLLAHALRAREQGKWGLVVADGWREARPEEVVEASPPGDIAAELAGRAEGARVYVLDLAYLDAPPDAGALAEHGGTVYSAAELILGRAAAPASMEN